MANICLYKIRVKGTKAACYALVNMMPLYSWEKEYMDEEGTDDEYSLLFSGACKWGVDCYTSWDKALTAPYTAEQVEKIQDGDGWGIPLQQKSMLLNCEIFCNSKDIDDASWSVYEHYDKGVVVNDECPKELHIKRGRDYDWGYEAPTAGSCTASVPASNAPTCKVRFMDNRSYWYYGEVKVGDVVNVEGAKSGCTGIVKEISTNEQNTAYYHVTTVIANVPLFEEAAVLCIWDSMKAKERKPFLVKIGLEEKTTKKKFVAMAENKWITEAVSGAVWSDFITNLTYGNIQLDVV